MVSYAGMHRLIYHEVGGQLAILLRPESARPAHAGAGVAPGAFWRGNEHYHGGEGSARSPGAAATAALMAPNDELVTPWPSYPLYPLMARRSHGHAVPVPGFSTL